MDERFGTDLQANKKMLRSKFGQAPDFYTKDIEVMGVSCCICMIGCLSSLEQLWVILLNHLASEENTVKTPKELQTYILHHSALPAEPDILTGTKNTVAQLTAGASVLLIDGVDAALAIPTQNYAYRSVQEPSGEGNVHGAREGFTEPLRINLSLIRRRMRSEDLCIETMIKGSKTGTEIAMLYHRKLVPKQILEKVRVRLQQAELPFLFDAGYLTPFLMKSGFSFFQSAGYTERPDTACAKICEGKIVILANGSPFALIVPFFFCENFQSMDDYTEKAYFASFVRILKYAAFLISVFLPGIFVASANFTPEIFPPELLGRVAAAELQTPLPLFPEMIFVIVLLEIIREAGLRLPKPIGHSVGLVAALVIGDAAVSAGMIGIPVLITAALTTVCTFAVPSLYEQVTVLRILYTIAGGLAGPVGIIVLSYCMTVSLFSENFCGAAYTAPIEPFDFSLFRDGIVRRNWKILAKSDFDIRKLKHMKWVNHSGK